MNFQTNYGEFRSYLYGMKAINWCFYERNVIILTVQDV
jgi:hypothetical protein